MISAVAAVVAGNVSSADDKTDFFETRIRPVLVKQCAECHSGKTPEGDFRIDSRADVLKGGANGAALVIGKPEASELLKRLESTDSGKRMPPDEALKPEAIADFRRWIQDGAVWPASAERPAVESSSDKADAAHWSFQPVKQVAPPLVKDAAWCRTDIDRFIKAKLEQQQLQPVAPADKRTLLRRATLDLTGLPPTPEEMSAFLADETPQAFEKAVDRLLASQAYGERWGRHWLDLARYADTSGDGTDMPIPEARYYRDYVIAAFNRDMPYDQFLIEQIAGDLVAKQTPDDPRNYEKIIATGYIALSRRYGNSRNAEYDLILDDSIDTIGRSVLGLTLGCARCHHHKLDPITTDDYYGLYGYFNNTLYPHAGTEHQKERADFVPIKVSEEVKSTYESAVAWAVIDKKEGIGDSPILIGGDRGKRGPVVKRGFLSVITPGPATIPDGQSGRLELAQWLASETNPLTARVLVNRLWHYHFGRGLVPTTSSFGKQAPPPSHPELLDWLAHEFQTQGWSIKRLHKQIMLSAVYQLGTDHSADNVTRDEANVYRWRFDRQRMDAETLRDSILSVSGTLEAGTGGRHPFKPSDKLNYTQSTPFTEVFDHNRRSVYLMTGRLAKHPFIALYDGPDTNKSTDQRSASTVALQALSMMNSPFIRDKSTAFAKRLLAASPDNQQRIGLAYELAFGRPVTDAERADVNEYVTALIASLQSEGRSTDDASFIAWTSFARTLLSSNEFVYVD